MRKTFLGLAILLAPVVSRGQDPGDLQQASGYFGDVKGICDRDNGNLWGIDLYAPFIFIDAERNIIANHAQEGFLGPAGHGVCTGKYPVDKNVANSLTEFEGKKWTMGMWPPPADQLRRNILMVHEVFHYWQHDLGLSPGLYSNDHMQQAEARILLKLEWAALATAITSENKSGLEEAVSDALAFRNLRRARFENSAVNENRFEVHEGMPEYTARKLCCGTQEEFMNLILDEVDPQSDKPFVRTFAYLSGPIYGFLLDKSGVEWRSRITPDSDLGQMLARALDIEYNVKLPADIENTGDKYGYLQIRDFEYRIAAEFDELISGYRQRLVDGLRVKIPMRDISISFNPGGVYSLDDAGTIYETLRLVTSAGIMEVTQGGCLIAPDWQTAYVSAEGIEIREGELEGPGWRMELSPGTVIKQDENGLLLQ